MYLNEDQLDQFREILTEERTKVFESSQKTLDDEVTKASREADEVDQASKDIDQSLLLRLRDRDRKLLGKISKAIVKIDQGTYGECEACGDEIGVRRLLARPVSTLCIACKELQERNEQTFVERHA